MTLTEWVRSLGDLMPVVSRIVIAPGPGKCRVTATFAAHSSTAPVGVHADGAKPLKRGPVSVDDKEGLALMRPAVTLQGALRLPDADGQIDTLDLPGQIEELRSSGLCGGLNVERLGTRKTVISTHAATQEERNDWLRRLSAH